LRAHLIAAYVFAAWLSAGCSSLVGAVVGEVAGSALQAVGLKGEPLTLPKSVPLRIHAGLNLNASDDGQAYSAVVRVFKLREVAPFLSAPYASFGNAGREREALGDSLMEVREIVLTPGHQIESIERLSGDMTYFGVVVLFRNPAPERWRLAFAKTDVDKAGVTIGVHRCAMTVTTGKVQGMDAAQLALLTPSVCGAEQQPPQYVRD
jgi:type VI secretion system protein VasD